jgi:PEP-CTERM motif
MSSWRIQGITAFLVIASNVAHADPVTLSYKVQVSSCESQNVGSGGVAGPPVTCHSVPSSFPMTVTFDSAATRTDRGGFPGYEFGHAQHSDIPLGTPDLPAGATPRRQTVLEHDPFDGSRLAYLSSAMYVEPGDNGLDYFTRMTLSGADQLPFNGAPLDMLLALLGKPSFQYSYLSGDAEEEVNLRALFYSGVAVLQGVTPEPVPEPTSLLLFGTGAAILGGLSKRRRGRTGAPGGGQI